MMLHKLLIFVLFASGTLLAQFKTASLSGTVADEAGRPLGGARIRVTFLTPSRDFVGPTVVREVWSGVTGEDGDYDVPSLLLGSYQVEASSAGFYTNFRWVPLRTSSDEMILDITLKADQAREPVQKQTSLPEPSSSEAMNGRTPITTDRSHLTPEVYRSPSRVERAAVEPTPIEPAAVEQPAIQSPPTTQPDFRSSRDAGLAIQIAAFQTRERAEGLQSRLQNAGFSAYVVEADVRPGSARYYRVRVGPFDTREQAHGVASKVQSRFPREVADFWIVSPSY